MSSIKIGLCGLGTVGGGTFDVLKRNSAEIARRAGSKIEIARLGIRSAPKFDIGNIPVSTNMFDVVNDKNINIVVELIGGIDTAYNIVMEAINNGKHVVTANKALIAKHGNEIFAAATKKGVIVAFEASVAGGIPVIKVIREGLAGNNIEWIAGIINGTCNYILTQMTKHGADFQYALKQAQLKGYAEADPTFDVEGVDAAHKLTILASIAFGMPLQFDKVYIEGISKITAKDIQYAAELGYTIKHLGVARRSDNGFEMRVHPTLIYEDNLLENVNGVMNAVMVKGDVVGETLFYGPGAGRDATASAVVADLVDVVRSMNNEPQNRVPYLAFRHETLSTLPILSIDECITPFYLRVHAYDHPGVLAKIAFILSDLNINIESIIQEEKEEQEGIVPIIIVTHAILTSKLKEAIVKIEALESTYGSVISIRAMD